jgi:cell division septation protein DedD
MVKELKPKLILAESKGGRGGGGAFRSLLLFLVAFALGVFVGMKVNNINVNETESVKKKDTQVINPQTSFDENQVAKARSDLTEEGPIHNEENSDIATMPTNALNPTNSANDEETKELTRVAKPELTEEGNQLNKNENGNDNKKSEYTVQIAAFKKIERAQKVVDELKEKGYDAYIAPIYNSREENWNLIRIGKFKTNEEAGNFAALLREKEGMVALVKEFDYNLFKEFKD